MWDIFEASITDARSRDILLILDGLDECEPTTRAKLLSSLVKLHRNDYHRPDRAPRVKTIVASRPNNDIKMAFDSRPTIRLRGEDEPEAISRDVELVIEDRIEKAVLRGLPRNILDDLKAKLVKGADRTFLWTTMVIDLLEAKQGASKRELLEILHSRDIYSIYHRLLADCSDQEQARKLLHMVFGALRPLTLGELSIAMAVSNTQLSFEDLEMDVVYNFEERVKALCGNLIRVIRSTVYLVHQTAREFLLQDSNSPSLRIGRRQHSMSLLDAHSQLLDICILYLEFLNIRTSKTTNQGYENSWDYTGFIDYAGHFWTLHYSEVSPNLKPSQLSTCTRLCNPHSRSFKRWFHSAPRKLRYPSQGIFNGSIGSEGTMQLDIAQYFRLKEVASGLGALLPPWAAEALEVESTLDGKNSRHFTQSYADRFS